MRRLAPEGLLSSGSAAGSGAITFEVHGGRTIATSASARAPLKLLSPRNHGTAAWTYLSSFGGGLVDGDSLSLDVEVREGSRVFLSTQGATRAYRSPTGTRNSLTARVGDGALLAYVPDPLSLFRAARFDQRLHLELAPSASLALLDVVTAGRVAMGERWAFDSFRSRIALHRGHVLADETLLLEPSSGAMTTRLRRFDAIATLVLAGPLVEEAARAAAEAIAGSPISRSAPLIEAVSPLAEDVWWFRFASTHLEPLRHRLHALLGFLPSLLGDDPFARRP